MSDDKKDNAFAAYIRKLQSDKPNDVIQFFDRKTYYSVYNNDALFIAKEYNKTTATLKYIGADRLPCQHIQSSQLREIILRHLLTTKLFKVEFYVNKPNTSVWIRTKKASPGYTQEIEDLLSGDDGDGDDVLSNTMAIHLGTEGGQRVVGVVYVDLTSRIFHVAEFLENEQFSNLESLLVRMPGIRECCVVSGASAKDVAWKKVEELLEYCGVAVTPRKQTEFKITDIEQDLKNLMGKLTQNHSELEMKHIMSAVACLIKYTELLSDTSNLGRWGMKRLDLSDRMRLDYAAVKALNLAPLGPNDPNARFSLYGFLNQCRTPMASRLLLQWIKQPLLSLEEIRKRQELLTLFYEDTQLRCHLYQDRLRHVPDLSRLIRKFQRQKGTIQDCIKLYNFIKDFPHLRDAFHTHIQNEERQSLLHTHFGEVLEELMELFDPFCQMIEETIDFEYLSRHEYLIKPSFDSELMSLYEEKEEVKAEIDKIERKVSDKVGLKTFQCTRNSQFGFYFKVSKKDEPQLRKKNITYTTLQISKEGIKFKTKELTLLSDKYEEISQTYNLKQTDLMAKLVEVAQGYVAAVETANEFITHLDIFTSLAHVFSTAKTVFVLPEVLPMGSGIIDLKEARHPCVEMQDDVEFIPNDCKLVRDSSRFHIITGPNMGGKSTYIRQVGLIILMAQMGCYVPCSTATISVCDAVMCRVGAGDSQLRGVSTFMVEMLETTAILRSATENSFIIIDELGRGTSTYDGFGLAWAIAEHICSEIKAFCLFATHFHELTSMANEVSAVSNYHVTADTSDGKLVLLYKLQLGPSDRSFGIHVAEMAHFPSVVVEMAKRKASELESFGTEGENK
jgi:DNA mismatch repair protein MSH2